MKIFKTANYKKIEKQAQATNVVGGVLNLQDGSQIEVEINFTYQEGTPDVPYMRNGDPGYPGIGPEWDIISVTGQDGRSLSEDLINMYADQIDETIVQWAQDPNNFNDGSDDKYDAWKDDQLGGY